MNLDKEHSEKEPHADIDRLFELLDKNQLSIVKLDEGFKLFFQLYLNPQSMFFYKNIYKTHILPQKISNQSEEICQLNQTIIELKTNIKQKNLEINRLNASLQQQIELVEATETCITYQVGNFFTAPFKFIYRIFSNKPIQKSKIWLLFGFIRILLSSPKLMWKNLNSKNLNMLFKDLKKEDPDQIMQNIDKFISDNNSENSKFQKKETITYIRSPLFSTLKQNIIYISPNLPDYDASSGGKRAARLLKLLAQEYNIFSFTLGAKPQHHINELLNNGVSVFLTSKHDEIKKVIPDVIIIIYAWFHTVHSSSYLRILYPRAKIIVDSVDVNWIREARSLGIWKELTHEKILENKIREVQAYHIADTIWTVTDQDKKAIQKVLPNTTINIVSNIHEPSITEYTDPQNNNILFFGGYSHYPNISAVIKLAEEIFPKVSKAIPDARLIIAGSKAPEEIWRLASSDKIIYLGFIQENKIEELYKNTFITVVPLLTGAGIKGKICEAISYMVPVVTNSIGNEGINLINEQEGLITDNDDQMVELIIKAMKRKYNMEQITKQAQHKLSEIVSTNVVRNSMLKSINSVSKKE